MGEPATQGRFSITLDVEFGYDGSEQADFELDAKDDLPGAFAMVVSEIRKTKSIEEVVRDWGLEAGDLTIAVHDNQTNRTQGIRLYHDHEGWHELTR